tara:strand:+ start:227 stop:481 length:255 start_codon:yes stop_codon:yes gene_type:complete
MNMTTKDEALKALHEASLSIACLTDFYEYLEDENNDLKNPKWVLKEGKLLERDIYHIQDQITILENFLDPDCTYNPYTPSKTNV